MQIDKIRVYAERSVNPQWIDLFALKTGRTHPTVRVKRVAVFWCMLFIRHAATCWPALRIPVTATTTNDGPGME
jgi:hypothetical protein